MKVPPRKWANWEPCLIVNDVENICLKRVMWQCETSMYSSWVLYSLFHSFLGFFSADAGGEGFGLIKLFYTELWNSQYFAISGQTVQFTILSPLQPPSTCYLLAPVQCNSSPFVDPRHGIEMLLLTFSFFFFQVGLFFIMQTGVWQEKVNSGHNCTKGRFWSQKISLKWFFLLVQLQGLQIGDHAVSISIK